MRCGGNRTRNLLPRRFLESPGAEQRPAHQGFPSKVLALSCLYLFILKFIIVVILIFIIFIMFVVLIILLILLMFIIIHYYYYIRYQASCIGPARYGGNRTRNLLPRHFLESPGAEQRPTHQAKILRLGQFQQRFPQSARKSQKIIQSDSWYLSEGSRRRYHSFGCEDG